MKSLIKFRGKLAWETFIIVLAVYNSILIPFEIAFKPEFANSPAYDAINILIVVSFFIDIVVQFRTATVNLLTGEEVNNPRKLAKAYVLSYRFWVDLLSSLPLDSMSSSELLAIFGMLKIVRVGRISKIIESLNTRAN
jgi:hypothetical protein